MSIDKNKKVFVIDFDNHLYDLLKDSYEIVKHTNYIEDVVNFKSPFDILVSDLVFQDGDLFELVKKIKVTPICLVDVTPSIKKKLESKVEFLHINDLDFQDDFINISSELEGYKLTCKALEALNLNKELLGDLNTLYSIIGSVKTVEKNIRYYKERIMEQNILDTEFTKFNKQYPTNSEFFRMLLDLQKAKKIKID